MLGAAPNCQKPEFDKVLPPMNMPVSSKGTRINREVCRASNTGAFERARTSLLQRGCIVRKQKALQTCWLLSWNLLSQL